MTRIVLLNADELSPGEKSFAQLILADEDVVVAGDHFVLRSYSPVTTIGGGRILDPLPGKHKRKNKKILDDLQILQSGALAGKNFRPAGTGRFQRHQCPFACFSTGHSCQKNPGSAGKIIFRPSGHLAFR